MEIADFVMRAEGAEKKLASLAARCQELEAVVASMDATRGTAAGSSSSSSVASAAATVGGLAAPANEKQALLATLNQLRTVLLSESAERDALRKENELLKTSVRKLEYRCDHLVAMLEVEEKQVAELKAGKK